MAKKNISYINKKKSIKHIFIKLIKILSFIALFLMIILSGYKIHNSNLLNTEINWQIDPKITENKDYYNNIISEFLQNKYLINITKIVNILEQQPLIKNAKVKRVYWNKLNINLTTHKISMRWKNEGYISDTGVLFKPKKMLDSNAPIARVKEQEVFVFFNDYNEYQNIISPLIITEFERDKIDKIKINTGAIIILGAKHQTKRLEKFLQIYDKLKNTSNRIAKKGIFDMRYTKGFALSYQ